MTLGNKDKIILESLMHDCRITLKQLSKRTNLTHPAIIYRIKKLEENNLILRYDGVINLNKFENKPRLILIRVPNKEKKNFEDYCEKNSALMSVWQHIHKYNYNVFSIFNEQEEKEFLDYLKKNKFDYDYYKIKNQKHSRFSIFDEIKLNLNEPKIKNKKIKLDKKDIELLETIQKGNGRTSVLELSRKLKISPEKTVYRFRKLKNAGYFIYFIAHPNPEKFNLKYEIIFIETKDTDFNECFEIFKKTNRTLIFSEIDKNKFFATIIIKDLEDLQKTLEKIYSEMDEKLINLDMLFVKKWIKLNKIDINRILTKEERK